MTYEVGFADKLKVLGAAVLGFKDLAPREAIALMDSFKVHSEVMCAYWNDPTEIPAEALASADWEGAAAWDNEFHTITGRQFLQNLGNEARGVFGADFWVDQVLPRPVWLDEVPFEDGLRAGAERNANLGNVQRMYPEIDAVVFTDVRYPNEAGRIKALGGVVWEVIRPGLESDGHVSEQPLPGELVDWQIFNDGDLDDLEAKVAEAMGETLC